MIKLDGQVDGQKGPNLMVKRMAKLDGQKDGQT
jgi:hypothetical protein